MTMHGPMSLADYVLLKDYLLKAANLIAPNADVKRTFVANLTDLEDEGRWTRRQIINAFVEALAAWTDYGADHELRLLPQSYDNEQEERVA